jgi:hypothetical protein
MTQAQLKDTAQLLRDLELGLANADSIADLLSPILPVSQQRFAAAGVADQAACTNLHAVAQSPRGDGSEALAVFTPISLSCQQHAGNASGGTSRCWAGQDASGAAAALATGIVLTQYLARVPWLARDVVWVVLDARCGLEGSAAAWLRAQQGRGVAAADAGRFARAGALQQVRSSRDSSHDRPR